MFSLEQFNFGGVPDNRMFLKGFDGEEERITGKQIHLYQNEGEREMRGIDSFPSDFGFYVDNTADDGLLWSNFQQEYQQHQLFSDLGISDEIVPPPLQPSYEELANLSDVRIGNHGLDEPKEKNSFSIPLTSLGILKNHGSGFRRLTGEKTKVPSNGTTWTKPETRVMGGQKLSTVDVLRLAGERFIQSPSQGAGDLSILSHPFGSSFFNLSDSETKDVELVQNLLSSAEKIGQQQYDRASKLLSLCDDLSSDAGNPVERVVYYFSKALREKIDLETGRITSKGLGKKQLSDLEGLMVRANSATVGFHEKVPFSQICQFTGIQAIIEHVAEAKKIHFIDLDLRTGVHCAVLMQALASRSQCSVELLKISAVATNSKSTIEETSERLKCFARTINLPFSFSLVMVSDMLDLKPDLFPLEDEEAVAINARYCLRAMLPMPDRLESLMRVLRNINPRIMVVAEVEASHNSPVFVNRFIEALFFFGAYFDCLEDCMDCNDPDRKTAESVNFNQGIRNIIAAEGEQRINRNVTISVWRAFFARYGMVEEELSTSSLYQASLVIKNFASGSSCTLHMDGKCLIVGWKGTPLHSLSAWKFI